MHFDAIVVGGGLVGAGLALSLKTSGMRIALIDAALPRAEDPRLFALNQHSIQFLNRLTVWEKIAPEASPMHQVHVSQSERLGVVKLDRETIQAEALGYVTPAYHIEQALNDALDASASIKIIRPARVIAIEERAECVSLTIDNAGERMQLTADWVGAADGAESLIRNQLNIPCDKHDYHQKAIVTRTLLKNSHEHIAYERFYQQGAIAMLPLKGNECATIWTADENRVDELMGLSDAEFLAELQTTFGMRLGMLESIKRRHVFPLHRMVVKEPYTKRVYLLGNAAHHLHPIAAQGFNLTLQEMNYVIDGMMQHWKQSQSLHAMPHASWHQQSRHVRQLSLSVSHLLPYLTADTFPLKKHLVSAGMIAFDLCTPLKRFFVKRMVGQRSNLSRLLWDATKL